jgi:hypothetical protein
VSDEEEKYFYHRLKKGPISDINEVAIIVPIAISFVILVSA